MPITVNPADKWGSTLLTSGDYVHKGPNQAGNKSLISYRSDIGVPGYTGYIAGPQAVVLPLKTCERTGRPVSDAAREAATTRTLPGGALAGSEYADKFRKGPADTQPASRTGGGYWITQRSLGQSAPFIATSTYRAETLAGAENTERQLLRSQGLPCTIPQYEAARQTAPRAQSADPSMRRVAAGSLAASTRSATQRPATAITTAGELVGYQTTTQSALEGAAAMAAQAVARKPAVPASTEARYPVMPHAMPPSFHGAASAYVRDYGCDASDPMERSAPAEKFQTRMATGRDLAAGTTRNTNNLPGYTGYIAASKYNHLAVAQSANADERINRQADACLFGMDQYARGRVPGYTGYKPKAPRNQTTEQPSQGPPTCTTSGAANAQATKHGVPPIDNSHYINSRAGLMTFFTATGEHVSDNGLSNAQEYYRLCRPSMMFRMSALPHVTHYGKPFAARNSLV
uniref:Flagellar associated protein n=1 Tax=Chlamydomonas leiostraca TaxID=1034604 RepID=A0A7S0S5T1_9CHLO|mmetsp:Transcript_7316/g.18145  ORF Transcript_7316/g.18145 Transcript_7316/m.18145 type:complete len:460 (+) Transcript_7316:137-1516(+)